MFKDSFETKDCTFKLSLESVLVFFYGHLRLLEYRQVLEKLIELGLRFCQMSKIGKVRPKGLQNVCKENYLMIKNDYIARCRGSHL
jgi:hypothetical protein